MANTNPQIELPAAAQSRRAISSKTSLAVVFKFPETPEQSWRRLDGHNLLPKLILGVKFTDGIEIKSRAQHGAA